MTATKSGDDGSPGGILYSASRDGLVISTELNLKTTRRTQRYGTVKREHAGSGSGSEEDSDSGADDSEQDEDIMDWKRDSNSNRATEYRRRSSTDGSRRSDGRRRMKRNEVRNDEIAVEDRWEIDTDRTKASTPSPVSTFRQAIEGHTESVADIVLADYNRAVISAGDDALVMIWRPHSESQLSPVQLGSHSDYVRTLAIA